MRLLYENKHLQIFFGNQRLVVSDIHRFMSNDDLLHICGKVGSGDGKKCGSGPSVNIVSISDDNYYKCSGMN